MPEQEKAPIQQKYTCHFKTKPCQDKTFFPFRRTETHRCRCIIIINDWLLELTVTIEITQPHPFTGKMKRPVPRALSSKIREAEAPVLCPWYLFSGQMQIFAAPTRNWVSQTGKIYYIFKNRLSLSYHHYHYRGNSNTFIKIKYNSENNNVFQLLRDQWHVGHRLTSCPSGQVPPRGF